MRIESLLLSTAKTFLVMAICMSVVGCETEEARLKTYPVTGKVLKGGKPINYATVIFHPVGSDETEAVKPRGVTSSDGTFVLTTYDGNDGAPAGSYQVTIQQWITEKPEEGPSNQLKPKYSDPSSSQLTATISEGNTTPITFSVD